MASIEDFPAQLAARADAARDGDGGGHGDACAQIVHKQGMSRMALASRALARGDNVPGSQIVFVRTFGWYDLI